jgi:hypothetical protein
VVKTISKYPFVNRLALNFPFYLNYYSDHCPFKKFGQLEYHLETIQRRRELVSAKAALKDHKYLTSLYKTIKAWGIGSRGSRLRPFDDFVSALNTNALEISELDGLRIDQSGLEINLVIRQAWKLINTTEIVENQARLVPCSKTLHHVLPDLFVPMDRAYTQVFFGWQNPKFQYDQAACFSEAFRAFRQISNMANPGKFVGSVWNSSLTKIIDNAVVGLIIYYESKYEAEKKQ